MLQSGFAWRLVGGIPAGVAVLLAGSGLLQLLSSLAYFLMGQTRRPPAAQTIALELSWFVVQSGIALASCLLAFSLSGRNRVAFAALAGLGSLLTALLILLNWTSAWSSI